MKNHLTKRGIVRLIGYGVALCLVVLGCFLTQHTKLTNAYRYMANTRQHAFAELTDAMEQIHTSLQKGIYASSPSMLNALSVDLFGKSIAAQIALSEIPFSNVDLEKTSDFVSRVGDYALFLSKRNFNETSITEEEQKNLRTLMENAGQLSQFLNGMQAEVNQGAITLESFEEARERLSQEETKRLSDESSGGLQDIEIEFPEIPMLIYDGPFSSHVEQISPAYLEGKQEVSQEDAQKRAEEMLGIPGLSFAGKGEGKLPSYRFATQMGENQVYAEVTCAGGLLQGFSISRLVPDGTLSGEDCVPLAKDFLSQHGYSAMKESYFTTYEGIVTINFAYVQDGVICYPDLIKVSVARDTGDVLGFDATGYLMCHTKRDIPEAVISPEEAASHISPDLTILSQAKSMIRSTGEEDRFCYELKCATPEGQHYIFYINAQTGEEEKILILLEDENGTLTL
ncbi:MAG: germination protein YpeB [Oscillospiraceae bacterium]|jgi:spore germination protein